MSVEFSASGQLCYVDCDLDVDQELFTLAGRFKITANVDCVLLTIDSFAGNLHELFYDSATGTLQVRENYSTHVATIGSVVINEWLFAGLKGESNVDSKMRLHGFFKRPGGGFNSAYVDSDQFFDGLNLIYIGAGPNNASLWLRGRAADVHLAERFWSDVELTAQAAQQAAVVSTDLVGSNYFDGGSLAAAQSSNVSNQAFFANWTTPGGSDDPAYSSDAPSYTPAAMTISGGWTAPGTRPTTGIAVRSSSPVGTTLGGDYVEATLDTAPAEGDFLVVDVTGFMATATGITVTDNQVGVGGVPSNTYAERVLQQSNGATGKMWSGKWTLPVPPGATAPFTVRATPNGAGNYLSMVVSVVKEVDLDAPIVGVPSGDRGTGTAATVPLGPIACPPNALVLGAATSLSSVNTIASSGSGFSSVRARSGQAAISVVSRQVTSSGTHDPAWTLAVDEWAASAIVLRQRGAAAAPSITTTSLPDGVAGSAYGPVRFAASGTPPFAWSVPPGALPAGLGLDAATGDLFGAFSPDATTATFDVTVDNVAGSDTMSFTLTVRPASQAPTGTPAAAAATTKAAGAIQVVPPRVPIVDKDGLITREWFRFLAALQSDSPSAREMAQLRKRLASTVLGAVVAPQYTAPAAARAQITAAVLCNSTTAPATVSVWLVPPDGTPAATNVILSQVTLAAGESRACPELVDQIVDAGGTIQALGAGVTLIVSGIEYN